MKENTTSFSSFVPLSTPHHMNTDTHYMQRCIELALNGAGKVAPNPLVGCVIVHNGKVISEGFHPGYGRNHAEREAIKRLADRSLLKEATLYVNLEPCAHHGKTPPCADLIIESGIPEVVIGTEDPFAKVDGKGIQKLKAAGVRVRSGIEQEACRFLNRRFFTYHEQKRPYIILKWAQSADGFMAPADQPNREPHWITGKGSQTLVHRWRAEESAILVGANTVLKDDPELTTRLVAGSNATRIVIDPENKLPSEDFRVFNNEVETIHLTRSGSDDNAVELPFIDPINEINNLLFEKGLLSVIVEGGAETIQHFIHAGVWDEARVFTGPEKLLNGLKAPTIPQHSDHRETIEDDILNIYYRA